MLTGGGGRGRGEGFTNETGVAVYASAGVTEQQVTLEPQIPGSYRCGPASKPYTLKAQSDNTQLREALGHIDGVMSVDFLISSPKCIKREDGLFKGVANLQGHEIRAHVRRKL